MSIGWRRIGGSARRRCNPVFTSPSDGLGKDIIYRPGAPTSLAHLLGARTSRPSPVLRSLLPEIALRVRPNARDGTSALPGGVSSVASIADCSPHRLDYLFLTRNRQPLQVGRIRHRAIGAGDPLNGRI